MTRIYTEDKSFRPTYETRGSFMTAKQVGWHRRDGRPVVKCPYTQRLVVLDWSRAGQPITVDNQTGQVDMYTFLAPTRFRYR